MSSVLGRLRRWWDRPAEDVPTPEPEAAPPAEEPPPAGPPGLADLLAHAAPDRHVLLAWGNEREIPTLVLAGAAAGAASIRALSADRPVHADRLLAEAGIASGRTGLAETILAGSSAARDLLAPTPHARSDAPDVWWMRGPLDAPDIRARLGQVDLVLDGASLARLDGDPPRRLAALHGTGAARLILRTEFVRETPELAAAGFTPDTLWHAGELDEPRAAALSGALALPQFRATSGRLTRESALAFGLADPWWWFMGREALARLLREAGWNPRNWREDGAFVLVSAEA